ncbi:MAG: phosphoribosylglycinamide formyltransferase [Opitutales bacterium]
MKIIILASGNGSNAENIIRKIQDNSIKNVEITALISDKENAFALKRAENLNVNAYFVDPLKKGAFFSEEGANNYINAFETEKPDIIVLAGFMKILPEFITKKYKGKIINLHPSLLPSFKGKDGIGDAFRYGVKVGGCTVHYVNEELDSGTIIDQEVVLISQNDTLESYTSKIHQAEYILYPRVLNNLANK